jgi:hypothetical protein
LYKSVSNYQVAIDAKRDKSGMIPKEAPIRGSYAEDRLNQLKKDREQYKVNHLGTIRMVFHKKIGLNQTSKLAVHFDIY